MNADESRAAAVRAAYDTLPEAARQVISKAIADADADVFAYWMRSAGLDRGGRRPKVVAERREGTVRSKLDHALVQLENEPLLRLAAVNYFAKRPELRNAFERVERKDGDSTECVLEKMGADHGDDPTWGFFAAVVNWIPGLFLPAPAEEVDDDEAAEDIPEDDWDAQICELTKRCDELDRIAALARAAVLDPGELEEAALSVEEASIELRANLQQTSRDSNFDGEPWTDVDSLREYIKGLKAHVASGPIHARKERLAALAALLGKSRIEHRSPREKKRREDLLVAAASAVRTAAAAPEPPTFDGPDDAQAWMEWAFTRSGEECEKLSAALEDSGLRALADFIECCAPGDIRLTIDAPPETHKESAPLPADEPASVSKSQPVETAVTPEAPIPGVPVEHQPHPAPPQPAPPPRSQPAAAVVETTPPARTADPSAATPPKAPLLDVCFTSRQSLAELASAACASAGDKISASRSAVGWQLIEDHRLGLAHHLFTALDGTEVPRALPGRIARIAVLGWRVAGENSETARALSESLRMAGEIPPTSGDEAWLRGVRLLLAGALLRAALVAPRSGAAGILRELHLGSDLPAFNALAMPIWEFAERGLPLRPEALAAAQSQQDWETRMTELRREADQWWLHSADFSIISKPGKGVWREMRKGIIAELVDPVRAGDESPSTLAALRKGISQYEDEAAIAHEAKRIFRASHQGQLITDACDQIVLRTHEAIDLVDRWLALHEVRPGEMQNHLLKRAAELKRKVETAMAPALAELTAIEAHDDIVSRAGASCAREAVHRLVHFLKAGARPTERPVAHVLHGSLLRLPNIELGEDWSPRMEGDSLAVAILNGLTGGLPTWTSAFHSHTARRDHESTTRILEVLDIQQLKGVDLGQLRAEQEKAVAECAEAARREAGRARERLDRAMRQGLITEGELQESLARLDQVNPEARDFHRRALTVADVVGTIALRFNEKREAVEARIKKLPSSADAAAIERIRTALAAEDLVTAIDFIERVERGTALPEPRTESQEFLSFFGAQPNGKKSGFAELSERLAQTPPAEILRRSGEHSSVIGVDFAAMAKHEAARTVAAIRAWFEARQTRRLDEDACRKILSGIGIETRSVGMRRAGAQQWLDVEAEPVRDSPVAAYGSEAAGRYRVFESFAAVPVETFFALTKTDGFDRPATFVLHFHPLDEKSRRELAQLSRERGSAGFVVVDTVVFFHALAASGSRIGRLLACALPFSRVNPYTATASHVPPEMFFGRRHEIEEITNPQGSCFVYGGRQLGKTALLRHIERIFSQRGSRIACWLDLKQAGIHSMDDIWPALALRLKDAGLPGEPSTTLDGLLRHIQDWLAGAGDRRVLLLLDEADAFLKADATDPASRAAFARCDKLKGLMETSGRRFKVVFAGLHNVQRTTRAQNHPLAHFGQPLCIGPLLHDARDAADARDLVEKPLAAAGYFFDSDPPLVHILAQSNYYPSLLQLYCQRLLRHMVEKVRFDARTMPPCPVSLIHVEDAYNNAELQNAIRDRFRWTIDLDNRYRVVALVLALDREPSRDTRWLRTEAGYWWSDGFRTTSDADFAELLEEMVGLGVLRRDIQRRYSLRSPNLIALLGTRTEIEQELENSASLEVELQFDARSFRRPLKAGDPIIRSALTAAQEGEIRGLKEDAVFVFTGCEAAGINEVREALDAICGRELLTALSRIQSAPPFADKLREISARAAPGVNIVFVPYDSPWDEAWLRVAIERVRERRAEKSRLAVIFAADPRRTLSLLDTLHEAVRGEKIRLRALRPWNDSALRHWLEDAQLHPKDRAGRERLMEATGGWPRLLREFGTHARDAQWQNVLEQVEQRTKNGELGASFGCDISEMASFLSALCELGAVAGPGDIAVLGEGVSDKQAVRALDWADRCGLVEQRDGNWQVNRAVCRTFAAIRKK